MTVLILYKDTRMKNMLSKNKHGSFLHDNQIEEIYIELREGTSYAEIAKGFDITGSMVQHINHGRCYNNPDLHYPIRDTRRKYPTEPGERDEFWDWFVPEPYIDRGI